ncbi:unnamed protein product [Lupinus luteus]|uniref:Uncharacterized protein n=1 Tax=Lupinus luteus TaxID=3873 RepID=A0AAV1WP54_LUPLU
MAPWSVEPQFQVRRNKGSKEEAPRTKKVNHAEKIYKAKTVDEADLLTTMNIDPELKVDDLVIKLEFDNRDIPQVDLLEKLPPERVDGRLEDSSNNNYVGTRVEEIAPMDQNILQQDSKLVGRLWTDDSDEEADSLENNDS